MTKGDWLDLTVLERRKYNLLSETMDVSRQLGEAMDRSDDVSLRMLLAMRQEPILGLEEVKRAISNKLENLSPADRERVSELSGGAVPEGEDETVYFNQVNNVRRILDRVLELDRRLNRRIAGKDSFYEK